MRALETTAVTAEEVGFAGAAQIGRLRTRVRGGARRVKETRYLITSASPQRLEAEGLLATKRGYWAIEAKLHYPLDEVLEEDKSRVRAGRAAHVLGLCRRLAVSLARASLQTLKDKQPHSRKSTRDFQEHLNARGAACGFALITAEQPTAWLQN